MICFLPSVHSSEDFSSSNYFDYSDDANRDAATIIGVTLPVTNSKATIKKLAPLEIFGIVMTSILGIIGAITGCVTYWCPRSLRQGLRSCSQGPPSCFQGRLSCFQGPPSCCQGPPSCFQGQPGPQGPPGRPGRFWKWWNRDQLLRSVLTSRLQFLCQN